MNNIGKVDRALGYCVGALAASLVHIAWFIASTLHSAGSNTVGWTFILGFALFWWFFEGFALTLLVMGVLWFLVVKSYESTFRHKWSGATHFAAVGAICALILGCAMAAIAPKPMFVEDQTFLEAFLIAAQHQGIGMTLAGCALGLSYWFLSECRRDYSAGRGPALGDRRVV
jgi:hypothetical protein